MVFGKYLDRFIDKIADRIAEKLNTNNKKIILKVNGTTSEILSTILENNGNIDIKNLSEKLEISERGLRSMLKVLEETGIVTSLTVEKGRKVFSINPDIQQHIILNKKSFKTQKTKVK